jgi:hypothetical protein
MNIKKIAHGLLAIAFDENASQQLSFLREKVYAGDENVSPATAKILELNDWYYDDSMNCWIFVNVTDEEIEDDLVW